MKSLAEQCYTSDSIWRNPRGFLRELMRDLRSCPELAWQLFIRELRANYRQSLLGYVWAFLPPLAWAATFLFLHAQGVVNSNPNAAPYPVLVLTGLVFWQVFFEALQMPSKVFGQAKPLLTKINFPREALILGGLMEVAFQFLLRTPLLLWPVLAGQISMHAGMWLAPIGAASLALMGLCMGVVLLPLSLLYQDVGRALALLGSFWLLVTPVAYAPPTHGWGHVLARWNPVSPVLIATRNAWTGQPLQFTSEFVLISLMSILLLGCGWLVMRVALPHLVSRLGS